MLIYSKTQIENIVINLLDKLGIKAKHTHEVNEINQLGAFIDQRVVVNLSKVDIPVMPTKLSQLENDKGFITLENLPKVPPYDDTMLKQEIELLKTEITNLNLKINSGLNADTIDGKHIWIGSEAELNALVNKDENTIYLARLD